VIEGGANCGRSGGSGEAVGTVKRWRSLSK
jgi:hypothetical protein